MRLTQTVSPESGCHNAVFEESEVKRALRTPVFFRMSFYQQIKFNQETFIDFHYDNKTRYQIDILIDWQETKAKLWIDGVWRAESVFYSYGRDEELSSECR